VLRYSSFSLNQLHKRLFRARFQPRLPPFLELFALLRQPSFVKAQQDFQPVLVVRPLPRLRALEARTQPLQTLAGDVAVVGNAQDFLHLDHGGIVAMTEISRETAREYLHRVAKLFAEDTHLMQGLVGLQIGAGGGLELPQELREGGAASSASVWLEFRDASRACSTFSQRKANWSALVP